MIKRFVILIVSVLSLLSCKDDFTPPSKKASVVVEGYIETNQLAKVFLTFPFSLDDEIGESSYQNFINSYAKVVVSSETEREVLTFKKDDNLIPPYYYSSSLLVGEAGKTYRLEVIFRGDTITAVATIPQNAVEIDSIWCEPIENDSVHRNLYISFDKANPQAVSYYKFYTRTQSQKTFYPIANSTISDETYEPKITVGMHAGAENVVDTSTTSYFSLGDTVTIKAATIDAESGQFWLLYDNETEYNNPFSNGSNLPSNINGGLGVWTGMNSVRKQIVVQ